VQRKGKGVAAAAIWRSNVSLLQAVAQIAQIRRAARLQKISKHGSVWYDGVINVGVIEREGFGLLIESGRTSKDQACGSLSRRAEASWLRDLTELWQRADTPLEHGYDFGFVSENSDQLSSGKGR
jgi:hypothetical protein